MSVTLYVDIETAPEYETFDQMPDDGKAAFVKKFQSEVDKLKYIDIQTAYIELASFYAEFSKIICIGLGSIIYDKTDENKEKIYLKSLVGTEEEILSAFLTVLEKTKPDVIVAHRGKTFDFPVIGRRLLIKKFGLPPILSVYNKKPWEVQWVCTAELWSFTDRHHYVSLITLAYVFGIPSPKATLDGSKVREAYLAGKIKEIGEYCKDDVYTLVRVHRKMLLLSDITLVLR